MGPKKAKGLPKELKGRFAELGAEYAVGGDRLGDLMEAGWLSEVERAAGKLGVACALEDPMGQTAKRWIPSSLDMGGKLFKDALRAAFGAASKSGDFHWWRLAHKTGGREAFALEFVYANVSLGSRAGNLKVAAEKSWLCGKMPSLAPLLALSKKVNAGAEGFGDGGVRERFGALLETACDEAVVAQNELQCAAVSCFAWMGMALPEFWEAFKSETCWTQAQTECLEAGWSQAERALLGSMLPKANCAPAKARRGI